MLKETIFFSHLSKRIIEISLTNSLPVLKTSLTEDLAKSYISDYCLHQKGLCHSNHASYQGCHCHHARYL